MIKKLSDEDSKSNATKKILKHKIQESKVTEKWIEEYLDPEYKRQYTKGEVSSRNRLIVERKHRGASNEQTYGLEEDC